MKDITKIIKEEVYYEEGVYHNKMTIQFFGNDIPVYT